MGWRYIYKQHRSAYFKVIDFYQRLCWAALQNIYQPLYLHAVSISFLFHRETNIWVSLDADLNSLSQHFQLKVFKPALCSELDFSVLQFHHNYRLHQSMTELQTKSRLYFTFCLWATEVLSHWTSAPTTEFAVYHSKLGHNKLGSFSLN